jgi:hypothetical protein
LQYNKGNKKSNKVIIKKKGFSLGFADFNNAMLKLKAIGDLSIDEIKKKPHLIEPTKESSEYIES